MGLPSIFLSSKGQPHHRGGACAPGLAGVLAPAPHPNFGPWTLDLRPRTATPASWPALPGCGAKRSCRSSGLRRGCRSARPKGPSPCSLIWLRAKINAKPQAPSNRAPSSNSNLRFEALAGVNGVPQKHDILTNPLRSHIRRTPAAD